MLTLNKESSVRVVPKLEDIATLEVVPHAWSKTIVDVHVNRRDTQYERKSIEHRQMRNYIDTYRS